MACSGGLSDEEVHDAVQQAFQAANPAGRTGLLMRGRAGVVWWEASMFDKSCLEKNNLAFNDDPASRPANARGIARISPTYANQWGVVAATPSGYCLDLGTDPRVTLGEVVWSADRYRVDATYTMADPTPWFTCLESAARQRVIEVTLDGAGQPVIETPLSLFQEDCPAPIPVSVPRSGRPTPRIAAPKAPTLSEVQKLAQAFDDALARADAVAARDMVACYNLYEKPAYDACALSEVLGHGAIQTQEANPWLEYAAVDFDVFKKPRKDKDSPGMYHLMFPHRRTGETRSISVQWVDGRWKLVGIVGQKAAGLTTARIVSDLYDRKKRDIFRRRLDGEELDHRGEPLNPEAEEKKTSGEVTF